MIYNSTLPKVFVYLLTTIEGLYQTNVPLKVQNRKNAHLALMTVSFSYATSGDCSILAKPLKLNTNWLKAYFLISLNTLALFAVVMRSYQISQQIRQTLVFQEVERISVSIIDSFPIPLCQPIRNFRSTVLGDYANIGYNATKDQYYYGCKCHALVSESGYVIDDLITPTSIADSSITEEYWSSFRPPPFWEIGVVWGSPS